MFTAGRAIPCWLGVWCLPLAAMGADQRRLQCLTIDQLVERLASTNPPPQMEDLVRYKKAHYPTGYDMKQQRAIGNAATELRKRGVKAFPSLVEAFADGRFSCLRATGDGPGSDIVTVGKMAWWIMECQVDPAIYAVEWDPNKGPPLFSTVPREKEKALRWLESRRTWSINNFQRSSVSEQRRDIARGAWSAEYASQMVKRLDRFDMPLKRPNAFYEATDMFITSEDEGDTLLFIDEFRLRCSTSDGASSTEAVSRPCFPRSARSKTAQK